MRIGNRSIAVRACVAVCGLLLFPDGVSRAQQAAPAAPVVESKWEKEIGAFEKADRERRPPKNGILFIGSSSIRLWKSLEKDFPQHAVLNRGFGGSQISDVLQFVDRIVFPYEPRQIIFYCGGNDLNAGKSPKRCSRISESS